MQAIRTVLYGFIGVRRKSDHERSPIHTAQVIVAAIIFVVLFIFAIRTVVHLVTS